MSFIRKFSIKLQEINLNVYEEHKAEREAKGLNKTERDDRIGRPRRAQIYARSVRRLLP